MEFFPDSTRGPNRGKTARAETGTSEKNAEIRYYFKKIFDLIDTFAMHIFLRFIDRQGEKSNHLAKINLVPKGNRTFFIIVY